MSRQPTPINILDDLMPLGNGAAAIRQALLWDYDQLGADADAVRQHAVEIKLSERRASDAIVDAGRHLIAVKERLQHGQWEDWLSVEFKMSDRTARNMMSVARQFDGKTETVSVLGPSVLYLLAGDSVPEPAREAVIDLAKTGQAVTKAQAKAVIEQHKPPKVRQLTYGALLAHIELMAGDGLDLYEADQEWLINYIEDALRRKNMSADGLDIGSAIMETRDEVAKRAAREHRLAAARAAAEAADRQALAASDLQVMQPAPALRGAEHGINGAFVRTREAATGDPRLGKMRRLVSLYEMVVNSFDEFGELTGRDIETLAAGREMRKLIGWLEREINLLEGRPVADRWMVEEAA